LRILLRYIIILFGDINMKNLKIRRKEMGYTCESLGKLINVQKSAVSKYERGVIQPSKDILLKLAKVLDCSIDYLFGLLNDPTPHSKQKNTRSTASSSESIYSKEELSLIESYRALNEEGQEKIIDYVDDLITSGKYIKSSQIGVAE